MLHLIVHLLTLIHNFALEHTRIQCISNSVVIVAIYFNILHSVSILLCGFLWQIDLEIAQRAVGLSKFRTENDTYVQSHAMLCALSDCSSGNLIKYIA